MVKCNSPRPDTRNTSASSVSSTRNATLVSNSLVKRSRIWREVTNLPSVPANGEVFTIKSIVKVGSSTLNMGTPIGFSLSQMVTPIPMSSMPEMMTMSPASASSCGTRSRPLKPNNWLMRPVAICVSWFITATCIPGRILPFNTRPIPKRPV